MSGALTGKVALITGAGAGIGEGIARRFADEGARVVVAEFDEAAGQAVADNVGGLFVSTDVSDRDQVENAIATAVSEYGVLDILVNNAWGGGVNMCSLNGVNAHIGSLEYNAAKEALRALTRTAAREWAPTGVTVNALCPAAKSQAFFRAIGDYPELEAMADAANPMGRMGDPYDDIAPVAVFLASDASRYLTGNTLFVDGGSHINGVVWAPDLDAS